MESVLEQTPTGCYRALLGSEKSCKLVPISAPGIIGLDGQASEISCVLQFRLRTGEPEAICQWSTDSGVERPQTPGDTVIG